jgi:hypothetical protein
LADDLIQHSRENDTIVWQYAVEPLLRQHNDARRHAVLESA